MMVFKWAKRLCSEKGLYNDPLAQCGVINENDEQRVSRGVSEICEMIH